MTLVVTRLLIPKAKLAAIPANERGLYLMLDHIQNELSILMRLTLFSENYRFPEPVRASAHIAQAMLIVRFLGAKCTEAWEFIGRAILRSQIGAEIQQLIDDSGKAAIARLKAKFGAGSILHELRNEFAFHYPDQWAQRLAKSFEDYPDSHIQIFTSGTRINTLHYTSDVLFNYTLITSAKKENVSAGFGHIMDEMIEVSDLLLTYADSVMIALGNKYLGDDHAIDHRDEHRFDDVLRPDETIIPTFVSEERPPKPKA